MYIYIYFSIIIPAVLFPILSITYFEWRNSKLSDNQKYSDSDFNELLNSKFSIYEKIIFNLIIVTSITVSFVGLIFTFVSLLNFIQSNYVINGDIILLGVNPFNIIIFGLIGFISGICMNVIFLNFIGYISPRFNKFVTRNRASVTFLKEIEDKKKKIKDIKLSYKFLLKFIILILPFMALIIDNYFYVSSKGLVINSFFSITEKTYYWNKIKKAKVSGSYYFNKDLTFEFSYILTANDKKIFDIWGTDYEGLKKVDSIIHNKGIPIKRVIGKKDLPYYIKREFPIEDTKILFKLFGIN